MARNAYLPCFLLLLLSFIFLLLCSISIPVVHSLYFLTSSISGGTRYGMWGWCDYGLSYCWGNFLYWGFDPFFVVWMTKVLVFFPISTILTFLALLALIPSSFRSENEPGPLTGFTLLACLSSLTSIIAFVFAMPLFAIARKRFIADGVASSFGPCMWLSLVAMLMLLINAGLAIFARGRAKRYPGPQVY